jgi:uncharacterized lipoprotein NlpE involved in copper resistance
MMIKKGFFSFIMILTISLAIVACGSSSNHDKKEQDHHTADTASTATENDTVNIKREVQTEIYSAILPCDNCKGIETSVTLRSDSTYSLHTLYIGRKSTGPGSNEFSDTGRWMLHGNDMVHLAGLKNRPSMYLKTDSSLIQLDAKGERITGKLADRYVLKRFETVGR